MNNYSIKIISTSKPLTAKERIWVKDTSDCIKFDSLSPNDKLVINVDFIVELLVHNDNSDDKEYSVYVVVDKSGDKYTTGSLSFWNSLLNIMDEVADAEADESLEEWQLKVFKKPSRNREGKYFITCSIL